MKFGQSIIAAAAFIATAFPCAGASVTLDALDSGFYNSSGMHAVAIRNHLTGIFNGSEDRSFFLFDRAAVNGTIQGATLRLFNPDVSAFLHGYDSPDPTETLHIYDVSTPAADITGNLAGLGGFADLGSGTLFGSAIVSASDNGKIVDITLNGAAVAALNSDNGLFVLGGALASLSGTANQHVFGFSTAAFVPDHTRQLVLDVAQVPEPSTAGLVIAGSMLLAASARKLAGWRS